MIFMIHQILYFLPLLGSTSLGKVFQDNSSFWLSIPNPSDEICCSLSKFIIIGSDLVILIWTCFGLPDFSWNETVRNKNVTYRVLKNKNMKIYQFEKKYIKQIYHYMIFVNRL